MTRLLQIFLSICVLKKGPQDLPHSKSLLYLSVAFYAAIIALDEVRNGIGWYALPMTLVSLMTVWALYTSVLRLASKEARQTQTLSATFGTSAILTLLTAPLRWPVIDAAKANAEPSQNALVLLLFIMVWSLLIDAHIIRNALDTTLGRGVLVALGMAMVAYVLLFAVRDALPIS